MAHPPITLTQPESPRKRAGILSKLLFIWLLPLFQHGHRKKLKLTDLYKTLPTDQSHLLGDRLEREWNKEMEKQSISKAQSPEEGTPHKDYKPSLTKALCRTFGPYFCALAVFPFFEECVVKVMQPVCLGLLLRYFRDPNSYPSYQGPVLALSIVGLSMVYTTTDHPFTFAVQHLGMQMRVSICSLIYRKALRVSRRSLEEMTSAQIVNFLSSDMNRFDILMTFLHYIWVAPLQLVIVVVVLYHFFHVGWPCLTGIALMCLFVPLQGIMGKAFSRLRQQTSGKTDRRLTLMEEILSSIQVIKMYGWERVFVTAVKTIRVDEVYSLRKTAYCRGFNQTLFYVSSRLTLFITLMAFLLIGNKLRADIVFVSLALYDSMQLVMTLFFPTAVASLAESLVAVKRIEQFLLLGEKPFLLNTFNSNYGGSRKDENGDEEEGEMRRTVMNPKVVVQTASAQWNPGSVDFCFSRVTVEVVAGEVLAVVGPIGSGKTSFLQALLVELPLSSGEIVVKGKIAYASQEPWIFSGSVRDNILFGKEIDIDWYDAVVDACALTKDFEQFPHGDKTLVGERGGAALSGGQKARINLARAIYSDADIYLLDDPLSAVDVEVSKHIFTKVIKTLLKTKVTIVVTHQLQYLDRVDRILLLIDGHSKYTGSYADLLSSGIQYTDILNQIKQEQLMTTTTPSSTSKKSTTTVHTTSSKAVQQQTTSQTKLMLESTNVKNPGAGQDQQDVYLENTSNLIPIIGGVNVKMIEPSLGLVDVVKKDKSEHKKEEEQDIQEEEEETTNDGMVGWKVYWSYFSIGSTCCGLIALFIIGIFTQIVFTTSDIWLEVWIESEEHPPHPRPNQTTSYRTQLEMRSRKEKVAIYSCLIVLLFFLALMRAIDFYRVCMQTSQDLHERLLRSVVNLPMSFFDTNPLGRILNRFAKDIAVIDETLPAVTFDTSEILLQTLGVVVIVSLTAPIMLIPALVLAVIFYYIRQFYITTARSIKRLEGVARSPVFSHISTTLSGLPTIRAFAVQSYFQTQFEACLDVHSSAWYLFLATTRWLGIVIDWLSAVFLGLVMLNCMLNMQSQGDAAAGLSLTSAMMLTSTLQWGIRQSAELANQMISVERVLEYCYLASESEVYMSPPVHPPQNWPDKGEIRIRNLSLKYSVGGAFVLKEVNCTVYAGQKVGVVGRTGAGKSSLTMALFRMAYIHGEIFIDGINTGEISLHDLRKNISIIPQEPTLFSGTIRYNLDPHHQYEDKELWGVLEDVELMDSIPDLYIKVLDNGANFSLGQRQLICLARVVLQKNKIIVMDEATASVDIETDTLIQKTIRSKFEDCTIITIAHRLQTIIECDKVLVLDAGVLIEDAHPHLLLQNPAGLFTAMVQGTNNEASLRNQAQESYSHYEETSSTTNTDNYYLEDE